MGGSCEYCSIEAAKLELQLFINGKRRLPAIISR
jgi:hypothetical protein